MAHTDPDTRARELDSAPPGDATDLNDLAIQATERVIDEARRNPYRTVLVAVGVGYVLGGGLPNWVLRWGLHAATRAALETTARAALD